MPPTAVPYWPEPKIPKPFKSIVTKSACTTRQSPDHACRFCTSSYAPGSVIIMQLLIWVAAAACATMPGPQSTRKRATTERPSHVVRVRIASPSALRIGPSRPVGSGRRPGRDQASCQPMIAPGCGAWAQRRQIHRSPEPPVNQRCQGHASLPASLSATPAQLARRGRSASGFSCRPCLEDYARITDQHLLDLILTDAGLPERGEDVVGDVVVVPARAGPALVVLGEHVGPAVGVVGEDHLACVALAAEPREHLDPFLGGQVVLEAEAVHSDRAAALHQPAQVFQIVAVAAVADDDAAEIDALLSEDGLLRLARSSGRPRVSRDRYAGGLLGSRGGAQDVLDHRGHAGGVGGALDDGGLHAARADAAGDDVPDEEIGHRVDAVGAEVALRHPPDAGGDDHVNARAAGHVDDQADVAAEIDRGE